MRSKLHSIIIFFFLQLGNSYASPNSALYICSSKGEISKGITESKILPTRSRETIGDGKITDRNVYPQYLYCKRWGNWSTLDRLHGVLQNLELGNPNLCQGESNSGLNQNSGEIITTIQQKFSKFLPLTAIIHRKSCYINHTRESQLMITKDYGMENIFRKNGSRPKKSDHMKYPADDKLLINTQHCYDQDRSRPSAFLSKPSAFFSKPSAFLSKPSVYRLRLSASFISENNPYPSPNRINPRNNHQSRQLQTALLSSTRHFNVFTGGEKVVNQFPISSALSKVCEEAKANFNESVELHFHLNINTRKLKTPIRGVIHFPNHTGKFKRVAVFTNQTDLKEASLVGTDSIIERIQSKKFDFDVLLTDTSMAPLLQKYAKILGSKGLFPTKNDETICEEDLQSAIMKWKSSLQLFKMDKFACIHIRIGTVNQSLQELHENALAAYKTLLNSKPTKSSNNFIKSCNICSTMGKSVNILLQSFKKRTSNPIE